MAFSTLHHLSDDELTKHLRQLAGNLRTTECDVMLYLIEVKARKLYALAGYSSLFSYCMGELKFSEGTSCRRLAVARVIERYPEALAYLVDGRLHITAMASLEKHLTPENHSAVFARAVGLSKRQLEWLIAELAPQDDVPSSLRKIPVSSKPETAQSSPVTLTPSEASPRNLAAPERPLSPAAGAVKPVSSLVPLSSERLLVKFTADREMEANILRARELLAHRLPKGELAEVFAAALDALLEDLDPARKLARKAARLSRKAAKKAQEEPQQAPAAAQEPMSPATLAAKDQGHAEGTAAVAGPEVSRLVSAEVRLAVWKEAGGRCTYVSPNGKRCDETRWLQVDHCEPWALGGTNTRENCRIYCAAHNRYAGQQTFGSVAWGRRSPAEPASR